MPRTKPPIPIEPFLPDLDHEDYHMRRAAVQELAKSRNPDAVPYLIMMLDDKTATVRENAIKGLGKFSDQSAITSIVQQFNHDSGHVRNAAAKVIVELGIAAAPALIAALKDKNRYVRGGAAVFLGKLKLPEAIDPLINCINDSDPYVLMAICGALGAYDDTRMIEPLLVVADRDPATISTEKTYEVGELNARHAQQSALNNLLLLGHIDSFKRMINDYRGMYSLNNVVRGLAYRSKRGDAAAQIMLDWCADHPDEKVRESYKIATTPKPTT
jgi:HEAT repeat protein